MFLLGVLNKIDLFDLTVKLIPSLAIKTKNMSKSLTNTLHPSNKLK